MFYRRLVYRLPSRPCELDDVVAGVYAVCIKVHNGTELHVQNFCHAAMSA